MGQQQIRQILELMVKIRMVSETIVQVYHRDKAIRTPTHLSIGQEAVASALAVCLQHDDPIFTAHRCHAAYLAKGGDVESFFAELCGKSNGICGGRAGSAHLTHAGIGVYASPILSAMIPVAVGAALSFRMAKKNNIAVSLFGDAAVEEGVFAESVNYAVTKKLPVLFVCENNLYSTHTTLEVRQPPSSIAERMAFKEFPTQQVDGNDAFELLRVFGHAIKELRETHHPQLIECKTYRVREHVGPLMDHDRGYRSLAEVDAWRAKCPIARLSKRLIADGIMTQEGFDQLTQQWKEKSIAAYQRALSSPWPAADELTANVY